MARKRMIDPSFWDDPDVGCLEPAERLLVLAFISLADDYGHLSADPRFLCKQVFGYNDMTPDQVADMRDKVVSSCRNINLYTVNGQPYVELTKWSQYQDLRYVSKPQYPAPNGQGLTPTPEGGTKSASMGADHASTAQESRKDHVRTADQIRLDQDGLDNTTLDQETKTSRAHTREGAHLALVAEDRRPSADGDDEERQALADAIIQVRGFNPATPYERSETAKLAGWCFDEGITTDDVVDWGKDCAEKLRQRLGKRKKDFTAPSCSQLKEHFDVKLGEEHENARETALYESVVER